MQTDTVQYPVGYKPSQKYKIKNLLLLVE